MKKLVFVLLSLLLMVSFSCRKKNTKPSWNTELLTPILNGELDITNLVADSNVSTESNSLIDLVYRNTLYALNLPKEVVKIPDSTFSLNFKLDSLRLSDRTVNYPLSLGQLALSAGAAGSAIISNNGQAILFPAIPPIASPDYVIDATQFFQTAVLQYGFMDITLSNGFPVDVTNVIFQLRNQNSGTIISQDTFPIIASGATVSKTIDLAGDTVEGFLVGKILNMDSPGSGSNFVLIDTSDALLATLSVHDLQVLEATAVFPAQNVINLNQVVQYTFDGGAQLKKVKIRSGHLTIIMQSTVGDTMFFHYELPAATDDLGNIVVIDDKCPPAPPGGSSSYLKYYDLSGFTIDMTGPNHDTYNTFWNTLTARIDSTGQVVTLSLDDSLYTYYGILDIVPDYVLGYLGDTLLPVGPATSVFTSLNKLKGGSIDFENVKVKLSIENGIGADGRVTIHNLTGVNSVTSNSVSLVTGIINSPLNIARALDPPFTPVTTSLNIDNSNSNITSFLNNLPDQLQYSLDVKINPNGNVSNFNDFAYYDGPMNVNMDLTLPLSLIASGMQLSDTMDFNLSNSPSSAYITSGVFNLIFDNGFPIEAEVQIYLYDEAWHLVDSLFAPTTHIRPAPLGNDCMASGTGKTKAVIPVDQVRMDKFKLAKHAVVLSVFATASAPQCNGHYIKIYSTYKLGVKLTGKFQYAYKGL